MTKRQGDTDIDEAINKLLKVDIVTFENDTDIENIKKLSDQLRNSHKSLSLSGKDITLEKTVDHIYSFFNTSEEQVKRIMLRKLLWSLKIILLSERNSNISNIDINKEIDPAMVVMCKRFELKYEIFGVQFSWQGDYHILKERVAASERYVQHPPRGQFEFPPYGEVLQVGGALEVNVDGQSLFAHASKWAELCDLASEDHNAWIICERIVAVALGYLVRKYWYAKHTHTHGTQSDDVPPPIYEMALEKLESHMFEWEPPMDPPFAECDGDDDEDDDSEERLAGEDFYTGGGGVPGGGGGGGGGSGSGGMIGSLPEEDDEDDVQSEDDDVDDPPEESRREYDEMVPDDDEEDV
eukprot:GHVR01085473.1.p1 GENE.GHVR01085473.1~~GHVR01085473.1.p1  ORF type:complete len:353 (-),score=128.09 GHVR01085473.1:158-1216(-)